MATNETQFKKKSHAVPIMGMAAVGIGAASYARNRDLKAARIVAAGSKVKHAPKIMAARNLIAGDLRIKRSVQLAGRTVRSNVSGMLRKVAGILARRAI